MSQIKSQYQRLFYPEQTLEKLIEHMQEYSKNLKMRDNAAEMEFLQSLLSSYDMRIVPEFAKNDKCEVCEVGEVGKVNEVNKVDKSEVTTADNTTDSNPDILNNTQVTNFAYLRNTDLRRVMIYGAKNNGNFKYPIVFQCNGVILDSKTWKPLVIPPCAFNTQFKPAAVINNLANYKIYPCYDGTMVTLYYYNNTWCMSSAHGYDVSTHKWIGEKTYLEAMKTLLPDYEAFLATLLPTVCYSIIFRFHEFHPLLNDPQKVVLIRAVDLDSMKELELEDKRLQSLLQIIPAQRPYESVGNPQDSNKKIFKSMIDRNASAFDAYLKSTPIGKKQKGVVTQSQLTSQQTPNSTLNTPPNLTPNLTTNTPPISTTFKSHNPHIHYGFILRDSNWHSASHVFLESSLLKQIRQHIYNLPKKNRTADLKITEKNRLNYSLLRAYLSPNFAAKEQFLHLFPQFTDTFKHYDDLISKITKRIIKNFKGHQRGESKKERTSDSKKIEIISRQFYNHISAREKINVFDKNATSLIRDYVGHHEHISFLFVALYGNS